MKILWYLSPKKIVNKEKIRVGGNKHDGSYVMVNDFSETKIAYSFGIGSDPSWDSEMVDRGYNVFMYDHTIKKLPYEKKGFHWEKIGICSPSTKKPYLKTIEELLKENGHMNYKNMILKIDTEGAEEDSILEAEEETLERFTQILLELHLFNKIFIDDWYIKFVKMFEKLNKTHQIVHIHPSNGSPYKVIGGVPIPEAIEVTYIIKKGNIFKNDYSFYPDDEFDYSVWAEKSEYFLGFSGLLAIDKE